MTIEISKETQDNLRGLSAQGNRLGYLVQAILNTVINEKGDVTKEYQLSADFKTLQLVEEGPTESN